MQGESYWIWTDIEVGMTVGDDGDWATKGVRRTDQKNPKLGRALKDDQKALSKPEFGKDLAEKARKAVEAIDGQAPGFTEGKRGELSDVAEKGDPSNTDDHEHPDE